MNMHIDTVNERVAACGGDRGTTRRRFAAMLLGGVGATLAAGIASAQPRIVPPGGDSDAPAGTAPIKVVTPEMVEPILQQIGYTDVKVEQNSDGKRFVSAKLKGVPVYVLFNCSQDDCTVMYFIAQFGIQDHVDAHYMNSWNRNHAMSTLYRYENKALALRYAVPLLAGVSADNIKANAQFFVGLFNRLLQYQPPAPTNS